MPVNNHEAKRARWRAMTPDRRFQVLAEMWPKLSRAAQVAFLGLAQAFAELVNNKSPDTANTSARE